MQFSSFGATIFEEKSINIAEKFEKMQLQAGKVSLT